jgi:hypothetical protein
LELGKFCHPAFANFLGSIKDSGLFQSGRLIDLAYLLVGFTYSFSSARAVCKSTVGIRRESRLAGPKGQA